MLAEPDAEYIFNLPVLNKESDMGKYDDLVFKIPVEIHKWYGFVSPRGIPI